MADKFRKAKSLFTTTLQSGIGTGTSDTITLGSTTGLPTDTEITLTFDRVDANGDSLGSSVERIKGTISGNNLINYTRGVDGTTEQAHSANAVVEYIWNAEDWNDAIDGILAEHNQSGEHTTDTISEKTTDAGVTVDGVLLKDGKKSPTVVHIPVFAPSTDTETGDGQAMFEVPEELNGMNITAVGAYVYTAGTTGTTDIQIRNVTQTADILSTKITIDSGETSSRTATTPAVIDTAEDDLATGDILAIDVDAVSTTPAQGLTVWFRAELP